MKVTIRLVVGLEGYPKQRSAIETTTNYTSAADALLALVPIPPGWRFRILTNGYAVYLAPDDTPRFCHAVTAVENPTFVDASFGF